MLEYWSFHLWLISSSYFWQNHFSRLWTNGSNIQTQKPRLIYAMGLKEQCSSSISCWSWVHLALCYNTKKESPQVWVKWMGEWIHAKNKSAIWGAGVCATTSPLQGRTRTQNSNKSFETQSLQQHFLKLYFNGTVWIRTWTCFIWYTAFKKKQKKETIFIAILWII